jgi:small-conductance mechanosensitive channel
VRRAALLATSPASTLRLIILLIGYLITVIAVLGLLHVPLGRLLVGGAVTGIVVGIAAQQTLGHVFAGLVILLARPFIIGDDISVRSGALGGPFEGTVIGLGLLYTTLATDTGHVHLPNAGLLASAVGPRPSSPAREAAAAAPSTSNGHPVDLTGPINSTEAPTRPMNRSAG